MHSIDFAFLSGFGFQKTCTTDVTGFAFQNLPLRVKPNHLLSLLPWFSISGFRQLFNYFFGFEGLIIGKQDLYIVSSVIQDSSPSPLSEDSWGRMENTLTIPNYWSYIMHAKIGHQHPNTFGITSLFFICRLFDWFLAALRVILRIFESLNCLLNLINGQWVFLTVEIIELL